MGRRGPRAVDHIDLDPEVLVGKPVLKGMRLAFDFALDLVANGMTEARRGFCFRDRVRERLDELAPAPRRAAEAGRAWALRALACLRAARSDGAHHPLAARRGTRDQQSEHAATATTARPASPRAMPICQRRRRAASARRAASGPPRTIASSRRSVDLRSCR